jgi:hypothetical protein
MIDMVDMLSERSHPIYIVIVSVNEGLREQSDSSLLRMQTIRTSIYCATQDQISMSKTTQNAQGSILQRVISIDELPQKTFLR